MQSTGSLWNSCTHVVVLYSYSSFLLCCPSSSPLCRWSPALRKAYLFKQERGFEYLDMGNMQSQQRFWVLLITQAILCLFFQCFLECFLLLFELFLHIYFGDGSVWTYIKISYFYVINLYLCSDTDVKILKLYVRYNK